jgi:carboxylate-amine ligase
MEFPALTVGIEEEYFLVDLESRNLAEDPPAEFMQTCRKKLDTQVSPEFMRSQIEVGPHPHKNVASAIGELTEMRATIANVAQQFGLAPIAASSHPFGNYREQIPTSRHRYEELAKDLGTPARRLQICGCHVHAGIEDDNLRIDLMNQVSYFLPHLLALSTSSPYWEGEDTGLQSYRLCVFDALPRTGLPEIFASYGEYKRVIAQMVNSGCIEDATKIWWDIRPSDRYPTVEMRIADVCTDIADCAAIAATYQALLSMLYRLRISNQRWRLYPRLLIQENRWSAMRYGAKGNLIDLGKGKATPMGELIDELIELVAEDADRLGTTKEVAHMKTIANRGTSADRQREIFQQETGKGKSTSEAFKTVVDHLIVETQGGVLLGGG